MQKYAKTSNMKHHLSKISLQEIFTRYSNSKSLNIAKREPQVIDFEAPNLYYFWLKKPFFL